MSAIADFAERFHASWLAAHPFTASRFGIVEHDDAVPDDSEEGDERRRRELAAFLTEATTLQDGDAGDDAITLACVRAAANEELAVLESAEIEHCVTPMPYSGPAVLLATAARTVLGDATAAGAYLARLERSGAWIDQQTARLGAGAAKGRYPVASILAATLAWAEDVLAEPVPAAFTTPEAPAGWDGAETWAAARDAAVREVVMPAFARWVAQLRELAPSARSDEHAGLSSLPGGEADYVRAVRVHTTLPLTAEEIHATGLAEVERLEARARALGATIGLDSLAEVHAAMRAAAAAARPDEAIVAARDAVHRAEARAHEVFPDPLPAPCAVTPMPGVVAASGAAPHYSPPRLDGARPGTYWFNTERPTAGTGWDIESVAFHEAVPGHHLQMSRAQLFPDLPGVQRQRYLTVYGEGWGLYAEQLAEEMGLYSSTEALLGALAAALMRAGRLVVDTGIHSRGWSRSEALGWYVAHVPLPEAFLADEIDRYVVMPGQALAYLTGKLELLRLRAEASAALGERFTLSEFHATVLDHGSLPMPVLEQLVRRWAGVS